MYLPGARWSHLHLLLLEYFKVYKLVDFYSLHVWPAYLFSPHVHFSLNLENLLINKAQHHLLLWLNCSSSGDAVNGHCLWMEACLTNVCFDASVLMYVLQQLHTKHHSSFAHKAFIHCKLLFLFFEICGSILIYIIYAWLEKCVLLKATFAFVLHRQLSFSFWVSFILCNKALPSAESCNVAI